MNVALVIAEHGPKPIARKGSRDFREVQHFGHHQHHDKSAVCIDRDVADRGFRKTNGFLRYGRPGSFKNGLHWLPPIALSLK